MSAPPDKPEETEQLSYKAKDFNTIGEDLRFRRVTQQGAPIPEHIKKFGDYIFKKSNEARKRKGDDFVISETVTKSDSEHIRQSARKYYIKEVKDDSK